MATQKFSIALIAGRAAMALSQQLGIWANRRRPREDYLGSDEAFSPKVRKLIDAFVLRLKENSAYPPVVYFAEWVDTWSAGSWLFLFRQEQEMNAWCVEGSRFKVYWQSLPDTGGLQTRCEREPQYSEDAWLQQRVLEALRTFANMNVNEGVLILLREPLDGSVLDEDVQKAVKSMPDWVADICRDVHLGR